MKKQTKQIDWESARGKNLKEIYPQRRATWALVDEIFDATGVNIMDEFVRSSYFKMDPRAQRLVIGAFITANGIVADEDDVTCYPDLIVDAMTYFFAPTSGNPGPKKS